ncbi:DNA primase [Candidatus Bipolaricaulis anaerobius]|uniref:DNA primase n=1 Tax=Candidatus Bipolaricaulis anaerobius TaxID=2026885 RepID=A0A2X3L1D7_9BACT|nr:DNA primase [Candidatus Bipolaricaulis anaerobius]SQD92989.1 DNA primase [Candidatus Bipolaricaulis anaerobius]
MPSVDVEEVKSRVNIVELIGRYITLKPSGQRFKGRCPFHPDDTPSLLVSPDKGLWHCFGCHAGGDAIGFLMKIERLSFPEALSRLARELGIEIRTAGGEGRAKLLQANEQAVQYFARELRRPSGKKARDYLLGRGLEEKVWERYKLGYAPEGWDGLLRTLGQVGVDTLRDLGLVVAGERGYYDRFRDRVMFTIGDDQGRPVAFAGRSFAGDPKYVNIPNTSLFTKGTLLYGLDLARDAIRSAGRAVLVEGYTDVISLQTAGIGEAVGSMGTALTDAQARLIARHADQVVIAYDRDAAGEASALRGLVILRAAGLRVAVAVLPPDEDPDSLVRGQGADAAREVLARALPFHRFFVEAIASRHDVATVEGKEQVLVEAKTFWPEIRSVPLQHELARELAALLSLREEEVWGYLRGEARVAVPNEERPRIGPEEIFLHFLVAGKLPERVLGDLDLAEFRPEHRPIVAKWVELWHGGERPTASRLASELPPDSVQVLTQVALLDLPFSNEAQAIADAETRFLHLPRLNRRLDEARRRLVEAETAGDADEVQRLNAALQALCQERLRLMRRR